MVQMLKRKKIPLVFMITGILLVAAVSISMALGTSTPTMTLVSPVEGALINSSSQVISFTVSDTDLIANSNYYILVNGTDITSKLDFRGHFETDTCSGAEYWVIDGYDQATISGTATGLADGQQTVAVKAVDRLGNAVVKNFLFTVAAKPTFTNMTPASGSTAIVNNSISVKVTDNGQVDSGSISLVVDNNPVSSTEVTFNGTTGLASYSIPAPGLANGAHTVSIRAKDMAGNQADASWSFNVQAAGQPMTFADSGKTFAAAAPLINVTARANAKLDSTSATLTIDGKPVNAAFEYKGHWVPQFELDPYYQVDSYNEATISGTSASLIDGVHIVAVTVKDIVGNQMAGQWNITVNAVPVFTSPAPANGQNTTDNTGFSVKVSDNDTLIPTSVAVYLDGAPVISTFDAVTGTISYRPASAIANGTHTVKVYTQDTTGNIGSFTWSFTVQATGAELTFANDGKTMETYQPALVVAVKTNVKIVDTEVTMKIDGQPVNAAFTYKGHWEPQFELDPYYLIESFNEGTLNYIPESLNDGVHEMIVSAKDILGNQTTKTFNFTVAQKPVYSGMEPVSGNTISTGTPTIKATVVDPNGTIDKTSVKLLLDNITVVPTLADTATGIAISYTTGTLAIDTYHEVSIAVTDNSGNTSNTAWKFYVNTKGDMPIGAKDCGSCHTLNQYDKYKSEPNSFLW